MASQKCFHLVVGAKKMKIEGSFKRLKKQSLIETDAAFVET